MNVMPISDVRESLATLVQEIVQGSERLYISRYGRAEAVMLNAEDYEALVTATRMLADPDFLPSLQRSEGDIAAGRIIEHHALGQKLGLS